MVTRVHLPPASKLLLAAFSVPCHRRLSFTCISTLLAHPLLGTTPTHSRMYRPSGRLRRPSERARAALGTSPQWAVPTVALTAASYGCQRQPLPGTAGDGDSRLVCLRTATAARVANDGDRRLVWLSATATAIYG